MWSIAKLALGNEPLLEALAAAAVRRITQAGPQGLSNTAWAFATCRFLHAPLFEAISEAALATISQFAHQELSNTAWAFAELRMMHVPLMDAISAAAMPTISEVAVADPEEARRGAYALAWAQGRLSHSDVARSLITGYAAVGQCDRLSLGLMVLEEEWSRCAPPDGAVASLETMVGQADSGRDASGGSRATGAAAMPTSLYYSTAVA